MRWSRGCASTRRGTASTWTSSTDCLPRWAPERGLHPAAPGLQRIWGGGIWQDTAVGPAHPHQKWRQHGGTGSEAEKWQHAEQRSYSRFPPDVLPVADVHILWVPAGWFPSQKTVQATDSPSEHPGGKWHLSSCIMFGNGLNENVLHCSPSCPCLRNQTLVSCEGQGQKGPEACISQLPVRKRASRDLTCLGGAVIARHPPPTF